MRASFDHAEQLAPQIWTYYFRPLQPMPYVAGQFIELHLPHSAVDKRGIMRHFTLSSSPHQELLAVTTKFAAASSSFKRSMQALKPGEVVIITAAMGDFVLPKDARIPLVMVGVGMGVTPLVSMIRWLSHAGEPRQIQLLYAAHTPDELIFRPMFERPQISFTPIVSAPDKTWQGKTGRLDAGRILALTGDPAGKLFYIAGLEHAVEVIAHELKQLGVDDNALVVDYFHGYDN
ncbi:MAG TPA: FAD-dependent oxidoreductase [Candidatus Saccharimonadales bacterium]|nr:FAD-dependent oxidoreductase [Candidatus Saccharimonadales bacterium]